ncbi:hypothetical protein [Modestobacter italicus]|uniref:hypothetical protein n=1 Tax=Modestobacter italicus (strain DSM 44449 / CECT 9708 / BC 501) TaxID=2732864 RepID=UPI001C986E60|nr:hypothetical protein [Modestobacter italicus]
MPVPRFAVVLASTALALEFVGLLTLALDAPPSIAIPLSMEAPFSLARLFVAGVFVAAAVAAGLGASRMPGRRTWWTAVAAVAAGIAVVKVGGNLHVTVLRAVAGDDPVRGLLLSAPLALATVGWLWWLSRHERRDRRRLLTCLGAYAVAAVGLSAVSTAVTHMWGLRAAAPAIFVEESGEALAGVAFLVAVLIGVAPRLVLPAGWTRRAADAHSLELPVVQPGRVTETGR